MSWLQQLYETYEECSKVPEFVLGDNLLLPICHTTQNAHIEVILDGEGHFLRAKVLSKGELLTIVTCTEGSAGRSGSKPVNHPLCDKLQYVAGDYVTFGGEVTIGYSKNPQEPYQNYLSQLSTWVNSSDAHPKAKAIYEYASKGTLIADLVAAHCLFLDDEQQLLKKWDKDEDAPAIFKILPAGQTTEAAFIRWRVETPGELVTATWEDHNLMAAWIRFYNQRESTKGLCMVTGETVALATQHPSGIRHGADKAKLISSNDSSGYTFRGRFTDSEGSQACSVSSEVSQKSHNALRWLVQRKQAYRFGDQVFVSWAKSGEDIPDPFADSHALLGTESEETETTNIGDVGQAFAKRLSKKIAGYQANIADTSNIIVMGLDSATPGRMAITFYRELERSEFLARLEQWHTQFAWHQNFSKDVKFVGTPAPRDIAEAAYGRRLDDKLKKAVVERLLPCIIDQYSFPKDLMLSTIQRVSNRVGMDDWEWEKTLGIACSLFRGTHQQENYRMSLEEDRTTRDYLYGRLLAVADYIEEVSLSDSEKNRQTNAARFMQRFASNPYKTWPMLYDQLTPYIARLKANRKGLWIKLENLLDDIKCKFTAEIFTDNTQLSGEYLLAYHCQRKELWKKIEKDTATDQSDD
ncbi:MAG: type I-C CRISPR-associated protein Cas8c/Csd1 [Cyclobacteriaceae bacterium]|nr:MAG: type I-C CRISPR-associated protein Cas8c/Csd1 [Cyclobacteriaceae bacterium]